MKNVSLVVLTLLSGSIAARAQSTIFIPVTPCRSIDTRQSSTGGPTLAAGSTRSFTIPTTGCSIPVVALAYSFNVTVVPKTTLQYLTIWAQGQTQPLVSTLNSYDGRIVANAAIVPAGTSGGVSVYVTDATDVILDIDGYFAALQPDQTNSSTAFGTGALAVDSSAAGKNSAFGASALSVNSSGTGNTATGAYSLTANTSGNDNTALGFYALQSNTTGASNTAVGLSALYANVSGSSNVAVGPGALQDTNSNDNTALGYGALQQATSGTNNVGLGYYSGSQVTSGSNNIEIGNFGTGTDSGIIRIGAQGSQLAAYIAGISGFPVTGAAVIVTSNGQLGVAASSIKYKEDVKDIGVENEALMRLRPVSFRYKGAAPVQYGLIAEEVDQVFPTLVARDSDGKPMSVQYHELPALLLNELQKQHRELEEQRQINQRLEKRLAELEKRLP